jgi:hypothetical protein
MLSNRTVYAEHRRGFGPQIGSTKRAFDALSELVSDIKHLACRRYMLRHLGPGARIKYQRAKRSRPITDAGCKGAESLSAIDSSRMAILLPASAHK